ADDNCLGFFADGHRIRPGMPAPGTPSTGDDVPTGRDDRSGRKRRRRGNSDHDGILWCGILGVGRPSAGDRDLYRSWRLVLLSLASTQANHDLRSKRHAEVWSKSYWLLNSRLCWAL